MAEALHQRTILPAEPAGGWQVPLGIPPFVPSLNLAIETSHPLSTPASTNLLPTVAARLKAAHLEECHFIFYRDDVPVGHQWFAGEHDCVEINTRDLFHNALNHGATRLIIAHNHPGGNPSPSRTDVQFTSHLCAIGKALGVFAYDHVIFAKDRHFSFRAEGLM
jgi:DNA repair protein RadC